jgi:Protein of unknown function (DUF2637)
VTLVSDRAGARLQAPGHGPYRKVRWIATVLAVIAGAGSFTHIRDTAAQHGQSGPMSWAVAVCVDLTCVMAARERQRDKQAGIPVRRLSWPTVVLAGGVLLSLAANLAQAQPTAWGRIVAAVPPAAFLVAVSMIERRAAHRPRPVVGQDGTVGEPSAPGRPSPRCARAGRSWPGWRPAADIFLTPAGQVAGRPAALASELTAPLLHAVQNAAPPAADGNSATRLAAQQLGEGGRLAALGRGWVTRTHPRHRQRGRRDLQEDTRHGVRGGVDSQRQQQPRGSPARYFAGDRAGLRSQPHRAPLARLEGARDPLAERLGHPVNRAARSARPREFLPAQGL